MDAIRKKMQSLKGETDGLYSTIRGFEDATKEATARADQVHEQFISIKEAGPISASVYGNNGQYGA